ncbi:hypothetical protein [Yoonia sp. R2-816]|uniref:hypothetical protein n=1 Tax=Yoonia sp. R2-816 TaxID=3342638 RepID=UPI003729FD8C
MMSVCQTRNILFVQYVRANLAWTQWAFWKRKQRDLCGGHDLTIHCLCTFTRCFIYEDEHMRIGGEVISTVCPFDASIKPNPVAHPIHKGIYATVMKLEMVFKAVGWLTIEFFKKLGQCPGANLFVFLHVRCYHFSVGHDINGASTAIRYYFSKHISFCYLESYLQITLV